MVNSKPTPEKQPESKKPARLLDNRRDAMEGKREPHEFSAPALASFAANRTNPRYRWYIERYRRRAWELDAMGASILRERVAATIREYIDGESWERHRLVKAVEIETIRTIVRRMNWGH